MGKVRPEHVKKAARELLERHPEKFNIDFQNNKQAVDALTQVSSTRLRNRIAGYITRLLSIAHKAEAIEDNEIEEDIEEDDKE